MTLEEKLRAIENVRTVVENMGAVIARAHENEERHGEILGEQVVLEACQTADNVFKLELDELEDMLAILGIVSVPIQSAIYVKRKRFVDEARRKAELQ